MIKLVSYNCNSIRNNAEIVKSLLDNTDVLCLQEIMLHQRDIDILNDFHDDFKSFTFVKPVEEDVIRKEDPQVEFLFFGERICLLLLNLFILMIEF